MASQHLPFSFKFGSFFWIQNLTSLQLVTRMLSCWRSFINWIICDRSDIYPIGIRPIFCLRYCSVNTYSNTHIICRIFDEWRRYDGNGIGIWIVRWIWWIWSTMMVQFGDGWIHLIMWSLQLMTVTLLVDHHPPPDTSGWSSIKCSGKCVTNW